MHELMLIKLAITIGLMTCALFILSAFVFAIVDDYNGNRKIALAILFALAVPPWGAFKGLPWLLMAVYSYIEVGVIWSAYRLMNDVYLSPTATRFPIPMKKICFWIICWPYSMFGALFDTWAKNFKVKANLKPYYSSLDAEKERRYASIEKDVAEYFSSIKDKNK